MNTPRAQTFEPSKVDNLADNLFEWPLVRAKWVISRGYGFPLLTLFAFILLTPFLSTPGHAQAIEAATLLSPWPPPGWPAEAAGEVRLVSSDAPEVTLVSFPIGENGVVVYTFPDKVPASLPDEVFIPLEPATLDFCQGVAPIISPNGVGVATFDFVVYADGEPWGMVEMLEQVQTGVFEGELRSLSNVVYARQPVTLTGGGTCPDGANLKFDMALDESPKLLSFRVRGTLSGTFAVMETVSRLDLSQRPVRFGSQ